MTGVLSSRRRIFCNRTLNLRSIDAIGYDMDYTLIHYRVDEWERHAFEHVKMRLGERGWPVGELAFDQTFIRGLVIDTELGNIVKANRFGYIKRGYHGTEPISFDELRAMYSRTIVDLAESRWKFMNTFFSLSEACLYAQLVELLDARAIPEVMGYDDLYRLVRTTLDYAHVEGRLKNEVIADPDRFVAIDSDAPLALVDQKHAGKKLLLITNSDWSYTRSMMTYAFDPYLPGEMTWRELFDVVIVSARKPLFFTGQNSLFQIVSEDGLLRPTIAGIDDRGIYLGGCVDHVETYLGVAGDRILYVGDHIFGDVQVSKRIQRWRTALVVRELEDEIAHVERFAATRAELRRLMAQKELLEERLCAAKLALQRVRGGYGPGRHKDPTDLVSSRDAVRGELIALDERIAPLARASAELSNPRWGLLMRAGSDKSHLARQIERYADIYTSRVSNFLAHSPFKYFRSSPGSLPHDPAQPG
ncbi:MAG: HAD-IG family 5'-nucleotidase [Proteobacteria bacterium]|nr:HAD-IG family 5'-nucleotidase [Pseudomonadota bacterium]